MFTVVYSIFFIIKSLFPDSKYISAWQCVFLFCVCSHTVGIVLLKHLLELCCNTTARWAQTAEPGNEEIYFVLK